MTILNISLCLPELDVAALSQASQGRSIVAMTQRFIVPDKSFALLPCQHLADDLQPEALYQDRVLKELAPLRLASDEPAITTHWAECVFCQQIVDEDAITALGDHTIWKTEALLHHLQTHGKLFLSFLRVYELPQAIAISTAPVCEQLYKFLPLPQYLEVSTQAPVLDADEFTAAKQAVLEPIERAIAPPNIPDEHDIPADETDILDDPDWVSKISEVGHSSDGHTFEKLVRKGLIELGFSNSSEQLTASLDPKATGGAGGLDFYADLPYKVVGECKASKKKVINSDAATQLVRLGLQNLQHDEYPNCIKIVVAAGRLTAKANQIAEGHRINIIRPEVMQQLVNSKLTLENDFDLFQLKGSLESEPFGEAANQKINQYVDWCLAEWTERKEYKQLVQQAVNTLKELSEQPIASQSEDFSVKEIRAHHNAKYQPIVKTARMARILENQYIQGSLINKRTHTDGSIGYYLKS